MSTLATRHIDEARIREMADEHLQAMRNKDIDQIMAFYAPEILSFDAIAALQFRGHEAYRRHWEACMEMCPGHMDFELRELSVTADRNVAFGHWLLRCGGTDQDGKEMSSWMRVTTCYRKTGNHWHIVHEHFSAPFDPETGKALFDAEP